MFERLKSLNKYMGEEDCGYTESKYSCRGSKGVEILCYYLFCYFKGIYKFFGFFVVIDTWFVFIFFFVKISFCYCKVWVWDDIE